MLSKNNIVRQNESLGNIKQHSSIEINRVSSLEVIDCSSSFKELVVDLSLSQLSPWKQSSLVDATNPDASTLLNLRGVIFSSLIASCFVVYGYRIATKYWSFLVLPLWNWNLNWNWSF